MKILKRITQIAIRLAAALTTSLQAQSSGSSGSGSGTGTGRARAAEVPQAAPGLERAQVRVPDQSATRTSGGQLATLREAPQRASRTRRNKPADAILDSFTA